MSEEYGICRIFSAVHVFAHFDVRKYDASKILIGNVCVSAQIIECVKLSLKIRCAKS